MKKITLLFILFAMTYSLQAQNPEIIGAWYAVSSAADLEEDIDIDNNDAPQNPTLIIEDDYSFTGLGACNTFSGNFIYDADEDYYAIDQYSVTDNECDENSYNLFEDLYFSHFNGEQQPFVSFFKEGNTILYLETFPGFGMRFQDTVFLGNETNQLFNITIYPNPAGKILRIEDASNVINSYSIIDIMGKLVVQPEQFSGQDINVSFLNRGVYFIKVISESGNNTLKFIKE